MKKREKLPTDLISTNRYGVKKELKRLKRSELERRREKKMKVISITGKQDAFNKSNCCPNKNVLFE